MYISFRSYSSAIVHFNAGIIDGFCLYYNKYLIFTMRVDSHHITHVLRGKACFSFLVHNICEFGTNQKHIKL